MYYKNGKELAEDIGKRICEALAKNIEKKNEIEKLSNRPVLINDVWAQFCEVVDDMAIFYTFGSETPLIFPVNEYGNSWSVKKMDEKEGGKTNIVVIRSKVKLSDKSKAKIKAEIIDSIKNGVLIMDGTYDLEIIDLPHKLFN